MPTTENVLYDMEGTPITEGCQIITSDSSSSHLDRCYVYKVTSQRIWFNYLVKMEDGSYRQGGYNFNRDPSRVLVIPSIEFTPYE